MAAAQVLGGNTTPLSIRVPAAPAPNPFNTPVASPVASPVSTPGAESPRLLTNANRNNQGKPILGPKAPATSGRVAALENAPRPLLLTNANRNNQGRPILGPKAPATSGNVAMGNLLGLNQPVAPVPSAVTRPLSRQNMRNLEEVTLNAINHQYYKNHKAEVNALYNNTSSPFPLKSLKAAINASRKVAEQTARKSWKLEEEQARLNAEKAKMDAELERLKSLMTEGRDYNVYNTIPITFKGDGLGYSAGFGYNFTKGSQYGNFVSGFPLKYYRVYGQSFDNATKKVIALRKQMQNTKDAVKRDLQTKKLNKATRISLQKEQAKHDKEKFAQDRGEARAAAKAAKNSYAAKLQQEKNAALGLMEATRMTTRAAQNVAVSTKAMNKAQIAAYELLKENINRRLQDPNDPLTISYAKEGYRSFNDLPQNVKDREFARLRRSPGFTMRLARATRLPLSVLRQYNKVRYGLGVGRTKANKTLRATKGSTLGAPAFAQGARNATAKNTRPWYQRMFSRKPAPVVSPSPTLGNAYAAMNTA
jgi:hypothetical protein